MSKPRRVFVHVDLRAAATSAWRPTLRRDRSRAFAINALSGIWSPVADAANQEHRRAPSPRAPHDVACGGTEAAGRGSGMRGVRHERGRGASAAAPHPNPLPARYVLNPRAARVTRGERERLLRM